VGGDLKKQIVTCAAFLFAAYALVGPAIGQSTSDSLSILQGRPDETNASALTGPVFDDPLQGISLRPPANAETIRQNLSAGDIAQFVNKDYGWILKASRAELAKPIPLTTPKAGLLERTAEQFKSANPSAEILRQEVEHIGDADCGILVARYKLSDQLRLMQQAIFHVTDQVYYVLTMTSPATAGAQAGAGQSDEQRAMQTFAAVVQSAKLIDRTKIKEDQDQRLFRTRAFYVMLTPEKIRGALVPEEFQRITQNGRDMGYRYVVEESEKRYGHDGIRIGIRSHLETAELNQVDTENWLTCSFDRKEEEWSTAAAITDAKGAKTGVSELGTSTQITRQIFDPVNGVADPKDPGQPRVRTENHYHLRVTRITVHGITQPIEQGLPPFYVPQALGYLLPTLLAQQPPKTYLFAVWSDATQEVVARYVDVLPEQFVKLGDKTMRVIPVEDRLGLEGAATIHYILPDGHEVGARAESGVLSLTSDRATLLSLWKDANLTPPGQSSR
jgi:hypothetical protein